jgi:hypothetical protein
MTPVDLSCPKHGESPFGFAFLCSHLASGKGTGFNEVPDVDEAYESRPLAICDACEAERKRHGGYSSSRVCAVCYDEIKAQCVG